MIVHNAWVSFELWIIRPHKQLILKEPTDSRSQASLQMKAISVRLDNTSSLWYYILEDMIIIHVTIPSINALKDGSTFLR